MLSMRGIILGVVALSISGCANVSPSARVQSSLAEDLPPYSGPKASIAIAKFEWKVGATGGSVSIQGPDGTSVWSINAQESGYLTGLEDMLSTALYQSGRFKVVERSEFGAIKDEVALGDEGWVEESTRQRKGKVRGADLLVVAAVTGWDPGTSDTKAGGGGLLPGLLGGVGVGMKKSSMAMDIRIFDAETSEIVHATSVAGEAKEFRLVGGGILTGAPLAGGLSTFQKTPMEKAIRVCIAEAVKDVAMNTPTDYKLY